jgi:hypothetical protein
MRICNEPATARVARGLNFRSKAATAKARQCSMVAVVTERKITWLKDNQSSARPFQGIV